MGEDVLEAMEVLNSLASCTEGHVLMKPEMASGRFQVLALPRGDRGLAMPLEDVLVPVPLKPQLPKTPKRMQTLGKPRAVVPFSKPKLSKEMKIKEVPNY